MNTDTSTPTSVPAVEDLTGRRIVAILIDSVLFAILFVVMAIVFGDSSSSSEGGGASFSLNLGTIPTLIYIAIVMGYYTYLEGTSGQTLGKKVMGIKVVAVDGPMSFGKAAIRTILRIVDGLPFLYLVGFICIVSSKKKQRLGDMAAGTLVVKA